MDDMDHPLAARVRVAGFPRKQADQPAREGVAWPVQPEELPIVQRTALQHEIKRAVILSEEGTPNQLARNQALGSDPSNLRSAFGGPARVRTGE